LGLLDSEKSRVYYFKNNTNKKNLGREITENFGKKNNFKSNFRLVEWNTSAQITPIYKAKTFICKKCAILDVKYRLKIANTAKKILKSKPYVVLILSGTVDQIRQFKFG
jgi:hypothetical protein